MSETRIVKVENILESQIPSFLIGESPLFQEFLKQYYISQSHPTGLLEVSTQVNSFKNVETYTRDDFYTYNSDNRCYLTEDLLSFSDTIQVNSTFGFPEKYGLLQIDDEIITYTGKTEDTFTGCSRGFSGITDINDTPNTSGLVFKQSEANEHESKTTVKNLNLVFYVKLFEKFKAQYLPDFEKRQFNSNISLELILSRARDFYLTKGSDISYKILFEILFNDQISIIKPQEYIIRASENNSLTTKNILVEPIYGDFDISDLIGVTFYQKFSGGTLASASVYNAEFRPTDDINLYEISLDSESFFYDFSSTKKTTIIEKLDDSIIVDSTVGFPDSGTLYVKIKNNDLSYTYSTLSYSGKTLTKFSNISNIDAITYDSIKSNDELIEDNLITATLESGTSVGFRLINVIQTFDYSNTNTSKVNDSITISSFGENYSSLSEFNSWIYNYPTYHVIKSYDSSGIITFYDSIKFRLNEDLNLVAESGISTSAKVVNVLSSDTIQVTTNNLLNFPSVKLVKKVITKSVLNTSEPTFIQNTYYDETNQSLVVAASGLPQYTDLDKLNNYSFRLVGVGSIFQTKRLDSNLEFEHKLLNGSKIYVDSKNIGLTTGYYFVKVQSSTSIFLYKSSGDLIKNTISIKLDNDLDTSLVGIGFASGYENASKGFSNQLLLKEFSVKKTLEQNKITSSTQINNLEDAYFAFRS
jgi:hypothetical protein